MASVAALEGVRVIDFGQYIAGPMVGMMLADFGADVIRIDPPSGPMFDTAANATWNRGKRSIALDLKNPADLKIARDLVAAADVVVENFRPGVMKRLGLDPADLLKLNPRLVFCSIPGFAADDTRAGVRAWEGVVGAATGCYITHKMTGRDHPIYNCIPFSSVYGAYLSAVCIGFALNARARSGQGQIIEVPLHGATFSAFSGKALKVHGQPEADPMTSWKYMRCKDGRWFIYVPRDTDATLLKEHGLPPKPDEKHSAEFLNKRLEAIFLDRTSAEWEDYCAEKEVEGGTCKTTAEWMQYSLARESKIIEDFDDPLLGRFSGPGIYTRLSETPGVVRAARPRLDADRAGILAEKRALPAAPAAPEALRSALQGVKVIDLGIILAIPSCGRTLAEFGADVVKIDSPHRNPVSWHNDVNRAKRSILLDLKAKEGLEIFWKLLEDADVVLENFRTGVADKLGVGYEAVRARRPDIIYCSVNAFGQNGDFATRPGREVLIQAITGMEMRYGGAEPAQNPFNSNDYATGLASAYGIAMAMMHRRRTGLGQRIHSALIYSATMLQSAFMQEYEGRVWNEPGGLDCKGSGPLSRMYQAADGWVFMAARPGDLAGCPALADLGDAPADAAIEKRLEARFRERTVQAWVELLTAAGIGAHRVIEQFTEMMEDPQVIRQGLSITREHQGQGLITTNGPAPRMSRTPMVPGCPAPMPGADAASILGDIGMAGDLERLIAAGVVRVDGVVPGGAS